MPITGLDEPPTQTLGMMETVSDYKATKWNLFTIYSGQKLNKQLEGWLREVESSDDFDPPVKGCKAIIGP